MEALAQKAIREAKNVKEQAVKEKESVPEVRSLTAEVHDCLEQLTQDKQFLEEENERLKREVCHFLFKHKYNNLTISAQQ